MDMTGERRIAAPRQRVWEALNDPEVLKASIPGCESLEKLSDTQMKATAAVRIGPIATRFTGNVHLSDIDPPNGYNIGGEGQGGVAGFAKGGAKVALADEGDATLLRYEVHAQVGGKLAQLGARLIDASAKQMADAFFTRFSAQVEGAEAPIQADGAHTVADTATPRIVPATQVPHVDRAAAASQTVSPAGTRQTAAAEPPNLRTAGVPQSGPAAGPRPSAPAAGTGAPAPVSPPAARPQHVAPPPAAISPLSLIPREPFGLPLAFWLGSGAYAVIVLLFIMSAL